MLLKVTHYLIQTEKEESGNKYFPLLMISALNFTNLSAQIVPIKVYLQK